MYKISHACQGVCICIAAKEDSSGSKESDGKVGVLVAVYYGEPAMDRGAQQMMERGGGGRDTGLPGAPTLPPSAVFPSVLTGGTTNWKNPTFTRLQCILITS